MSQERLIVACDFGTTTFRGLVAEVDEAGGFYIVAHASGPAHGFQDGDFTDLGTGSRYIAEIIKALEDASRTYITGFTYNISGSHLHSLRSTAQVPIGPGPRPIREADLEEVRLRARSLAMPFDQKILSVTPVEYVVDRVRGIVDPLGRVGSLLEMHAHLITGSRSVLGNIENAVDNAGYKPLGDEVDVLAAARALLTKEDLAKGVMLIDIGGHMTNWVVYAGGSIVANGSVPYGGIILTRDLAHGLRLEEEEAERIKRENGVVLRSLVDHVPVRVLFEEDRPEVTPGLVAAILEPRMEEILTLVKEDYGDLGQLAKLQSGVVLTGGGSRCRGTRRLCEEVFDLPARECYLPVDLPGAEDLPAGQWATAIGLTLWAAADAVSGAPQETAAAGGVLGKLKGLFRSGRRAEALKAES